MQLKYLVDFDPQLTEIISETKYMEQLGFSVPELARNVALQVTESCPFTEKTEWFERQNQVLMSCCFVILF